VEAADAHAGERQEVGAAHAAEPCDRDALAAKYLLLRFGDPAEVASKRL
jgi:hypothetical protein